MNSEENISAVIEEIVVDSVTEDAATDLLERAEVEGLNLEFAEDAAELQDEVAEVFFRQRGAVG
ncbi:MAG: hypothetical protein HC902_06810 [Calothrix sp. SM1_5_4]|nr:hypothetical protein [Calothrix sp. SM1_5_4]